MKTELHTNQEVPLAVDMDGTLVSTDLLWESLFLLIKANPLFILMLPIWLMAGKAGFKSEIAKRVTLDAAHLPYREDFLSYLRRERADGRELILVTAAAEPLAKAVAEYLGIFSSVHATTPDRNLAGSRKVELLTGLYGPKSFDYAGNDKADLPVFEAARAAIVVAPDTSAKRFQRAHNSLQFDAKPAGLKTYLKMLRAHQWLKNLLVFAPAILAHTIVEPHAFMASFVGFVAFSVAASAIYILNDIIDLPVDRQHPTKRHRPFASGALSIPFGLTVSALLLLLAAGICTLLPPMFAVVITIYLVTTTAYTLAIKRMLLIDVICLAGLYSLRLLGGNAAASVPLSFWLMAFGLFFFLSLALVKRYVELQSATVDEGDRVAGRGYRAEDIDIVGQSGVASAFAAVLVLALYIQSSAVWELYEEPWLIWPIIPIVLYINVRIWILAHRREMHHDPVVFIATDWRSQVFVALGVFFIILASVV